MRALLAMLSSPRSIEVSPASIRSRVVLPAPLRPATVMRSRRSSLNETPRRSGAPAMSLPRLEAMATAMSLIVFRRPAPLECVAVRRLSFAISTTVLLALLVFAPAALAHDGGEGLWGETNDKVTAAVGG